MFTDPKGGSATWKCSWFVLSFPAAAVTICLRPEATPFVARKLIALSNPLVPSCDPVVTPRLKLMATGVVPAKLRRFVTAFWISSVVKVVFATRREAPGAIPVNRPPERNPLPAAVPDTWVPCHSVSTPAVPALGSQWTTRGEDGLPLTKKSRCPEDRPLSQIPTQV